MQAVMLRLNEIIDEDDPFVFVADSTQRALYNIVLKAYRTAYINADSVDDFKAGFEFYWTKNINKYKDLLNGSGNLFQKLYDFRNGTSVHSGSDSTNKQQTKTETFSPGDKVTTKYGHTMSQDYSADEADNRNTEKRFEQNAVETSTNAKTKATYTYGADTDKGDTTERSGSNTTTTKYSGDPDTVKHDLTITDTLADYDPVRFEQALRGVNLYDMWIDEFRPLFMEILFYD